LPDVHTPPERGETPQQKTLGQRLTSPRMVLAALAVTLLLALLLTPEPQDGLMTTLDSRRTDARGAKALHDLADGLGWPVSRNSKALATPLDSNAVYLILEPEKQPSAAEIHAVLNAVERGAGLVVAELRREFSDSLWRRIGVESSYSYGNLTTGYRTEEQSCPASLQQRGTLSFSEDHISSFGLTLESGTNADIVLATIDRNASVLRMEQAAVRERAQGDSTAADSLMREAARSSESGGERAEQPAVAGFSLGKGRVMYFADGDLLRNDVLRYCPWGADVLAVRSLEWVSRDERPRLVFDESHRNERVAMWYIRLAGLIARSADGRVAGTLALAAIALILSLARRPLPVTSSRKLERRSPLEHVDALARAYAQAGATKTAARRLVRGLRRRHSSLVRHGDDEEFLQRIAERHPALSEHISVLRQACTQRIPSGQLDRLLEAVDAVDDTITRK